MQIDAARSWELPAAFTDALAQAKLAHQSVFIFLNRTGAGVRRCLTCGKLVRCPECQAPLIAHRGHSTTCRVCGTPASVPTHCRHCHGTTLALRGFGTEQLAERLRPIVGNVMILDRNHQLSIINYQSSVIIGTEFALPYLAHNPPVITLTLGIDELRGVPNYRTGERVIRLVATLATLSTGRLLIATLDPGDAWLRHLARHNEGTLIADELAERQAAGYPPATDLIELKAATANQLDSVSKLLAAEGIRTLGPIEASLNRPAQLVVKFPKDRNREPLFGTLERAGQLRHITVNTDPILD